MTRLTLAGLGKALNEDLRLVSSVGYFVVITRDWRGRSDVNGVLEWHGRAGDVPSETLWLETQDGRVRQVHVVNSSIRAALGRLDITVRIQAVDAEQWIPQEVVG